MIPYGRQFIDEADIEAVVAVLRSDFITQGPAIARFEESVAQFCGARHAVALANATAALHIGALALGLEPGDRLWTSPNTFVASANCGLYCGARVDFVDIDSRTYNMSATCLDAKLEAAAANGTLPKVLVPVHFSGQPCEMEAIGALAAKYGVRVMEDASHAIGAEYRGEKVGGRHADLTIFSFHPVKVLTTGEGGMLLTNDSTLYEKLIRLRSHGITRDARFLEGPADGPWAYQQVDLGFNYRMTDIQAALGASQMTKLAAFLERRRELAARYDRLLADQPLILPWQHPDTLSAWHLYVVRPDPGRTAITRAELYAGLRERGVAPQVHYIPVHTQPYYQKLGFEAGDFPMAEAYYNDALSLPMFYSLSDSEQDCVVTALKEILTHE
ncbi:MAG TPA: UDP-4-amino-4,6-dideoxy-N-acetyl-beta-L-altrosamine transaminase [Prosthecobacter sp.]|nr:UDP-4-amino-4,6-dideoxy-N-acetyl-beta-L-altrosamine transaminase [Prosthecobacter sp.]